MRALLLPLALVLACAPEPTPDGPGDDGYQLPDGLVPLELTVGAGGDWPDEQYLYTTFVNGTKGGGVAAVVDRDGEYVWAWPVEERHLCLQLEANADHTRFESALFASHDFEDVGTHHVLDRAGESTAATRIVNGHHFYRQLDDGTLVYIAADIRDWYDEEDDITRSVVGDALMEIAPDGTQREVYNTWDHLEVELGPWSAFSIYGSNLDWSHGNSIDYDPDTDRYLLSFANIHTVAVIDRTSGAPLRYLHGDEPALGETESAFAHQHDVTWMDNGNVLMVSTNVGTRTVEFALADEGLETVWSYDHPEVSTFLGSARRLPSGDTLISGGSSGIIRQVDAAGEVVWELWAERGYLTGNTITGG